MYETFRGLLLKERICSRRESKFFPFRVAPKEVGGGEGGGGGGEANLHVRFISLVGMPMTLKGSGNSWAKGAVFTIMPASPPLLLSVCVPGISKHTCNA